MVIAAGYCHTPRLLLLRVYSSSGNYPFAMQHKIALIAGLIGRSQKSNRLVLLQIVPSLDHAAELSGRQLLLVLVLDLGEVE